MSWNTRLGWEDVGNPRGWRVQYDLQQFIEDELELGERVAEWLDSERFEKWSALIEVQYVRDCTAEKLRGFPMNWCITITGSGSAW